MYLRLRPTFNIFDPETILAARCHGTRPADHDDFPLYGFKMARETRFLCQMTDSVLLFNFIPHLHSPNVNSFRDMSEYRPPAPCAQRRAGLQPWAAGKPQRPPARRRADAFRGARSGAVPTPPYIHLVQ